MNKPMTYFLTKPPTSPYKDITYITPQRTFATIPADEVKRLITEWGAVSAEVARTESLNPKCPMPDLYAKVAAALEHRDDLRAEAERQNDSPEVLAASNANRPAVINGDKARIMDKLASIATADIERAANMGNLRANGGGT